MSDDQKTRVIASIRDWFLEVCVEDERYQGDSAKVHAQRDAHDVYRSVVAPLLTEKDAAFAKLDELNRMERATRAREAENERDKFADLQRQVAAAEASRRDWAAETETVAMGYQELLGSIWLYINWRYVTKQLTTEQKVLFADAVDANVGGDPYDSGPKADRWWRPSSPSPGVHTEPAIEGPGVLPEGGAQ